MKSHVNIAYFSQRIFLDEGISLVRRFGFAEAASISGTSGVLAMLTKSTRPQLRLVLPVEMKIPAALAR